RTAATMKEMARIFAARNARTRRMRARPIRRAVSIARRRGGRRGSATWVMSPWVRQAARTRLIGISNAAKIYAHYWSEAGLAECYRRYQNCYPIRWDALGKRTIEERRFVEIPGR